MTKEFQKVFTEESELIKKAHRIGCKQYSCESGCTKEANGKFECKNIKYSTERVKGASYAYDTSNVPTCNKNRQSHKTGDMSVSKGGTKKRAIKL